MEKTNANETAELIFQAIHYRNSDLLLDLAQANQSILGHIRASDGRTPLHFAAINGITDCVNVLCKYVDVDAVTSVDEDLKTALLLAAQSGHVDTVRALIQNGADPFYCDANGYSALQLAHLNNHGKVAEVLFESIDNIKKESDRINKELCKAVEANEFDRVLDLLSQSTSYTQRDILTSGKSGEKAPLYIACEKGFCGIIGALMSIEGHTLIDPPTGNTLLHAVIQSGDLEATKLVLEQYADQMDVINNSKELPFHFACSHGNVDIVNLLLTFEYKPNLINLFEKTVNGLSYEFVCDLNASDSHCRTAFHLAVENGHEQVVEALVEFKTQLYRQNELGEMEPLQHGSPFLLDTYAVNGRTPLMTGVCNQNENIVEVLLENGADVNLPIAITDIEIANLRADEARCVGSGALIEAAQSKNVELVKRLFFHGAVDYDNQALRQASKQSNSPLLTVFLEQLTFTDPENRIHLPKTGFSAIDRLKAMDLLPVLRPNVPCRLDWQNAGLERLGVEFMMAAALRFNPRVRNLKMALAAITRIDLADNSLTELPEELFQLSSIKILNLDHNKLEAIVMPRAEFCCPYLENLSIEGNELDDLPSELFLSKHFPSLKSANFCKNKLRRLPGSIWKHPTLSDLNLSDNFICDLSTPSPERSRREPRQRGSRNPYVAAYHSSRAMVERKRESEAEKKRLERTKTAEVERKVGVNVQKNDVIRSNIWQTELNMAVVEDDETVKDIDQSNSTNSLKNLNLAGNKLRSVPECLACFCPRLTKLDLSRNDLSTLKSVECFPATLKNLNLAYNKLAIMFRRAEGADLNCFVQMILPEETVQPVQSVSVSRHSRSRSKSVARNQQRSLSIIRANKETENTNLCSHKTHCRLENLKTLNLSHNKLSALDLFIPFEARNEGLDTVNWRDSNDQFRPYLIFPSLTNLDLSSNELKSIPPTISLLSQLAVLNLSQNKTLEKLPVELGLLDKLWGVQLNGCALKDPLKGIVGNGNFKTMDLISFLRHELDNSKPHRKLKLMLLGRSEVGKSTLLAQMRTEGHVAKISLNSESWAARMGHAPSKSFSRTSMKDQRRAPLDIAEWMYEPPKSSKTLKSNGPVTFRTWDFEKLQKSPNKCHKPSSRAEIAINEIHDWLLSIHSRAPNATVVIVGTHLDAVHENIQRFPDDYLQNFERTLQQRFVNVPDADKKGLPRVVASVFVSTKSRSNVQQLCDLIYCASQQIKALGRRQKLLDEKVPSSFLYLEKLVVSMTDEYRGRGDEPILKLDALWNRISEEYHNSKISGSQSTASLVSISGHGNDKQPITRRLFRDKTEFRQAIQFLHENGVIISFDDIQLRDYVFIDPPWLYTVLRMAFVIPNHKSTASTLSTTTNSNVILSTSELFHQLKANLAERKIKFSMKNGHLRQCLLPLLARFELALLYSPRQLLISPLLPDEYLLRADYPGAKVKIRAKIDKFQLKSTVLTSMMNSAIDFLTPKNSARLVHGRLTRQLGYKAPSTPRMASSTASVDEKVEDLGNDFKVEAKQTDLYRRLFQMQYVPPGFWPRLTTRLLNDDKLCQIISNLFIVNEDSVLMNDCALYSEIFEALNSEKSDLKGGFEFLLWQTGVETLFFNYFLMSVKQFLPLANVRDTNYSVSELKVRGEDGVWRKISLESDFIVELLVPLYKVDITYKGVDYTITTCPKQATKFLASVVGIIDDLLEDWFPSLGTRFVHSSDGQLLVDRLIPCSKCASAQERAEKQWRRDRKTSDPEEKTPIHLFSVEECILAIYDEKNAQYGLPKNLRPAEPTKIECPIHGKCELEALAPDVCFEDLNPDFAIDVTAIKRGKLLGQGAFGSVYSGFFKMNNSEVYDEVALKILEPISDDPQQRIRVPSNQADRLESVAKFYYVARQELNMLCDLQHPHITVLVGFSRPPITLLMELAPHGALDQMLAKYRKSDTRLAPETLQATCGQLAKALEFLHSNHIIYRDLKAENVLVWRFPLPRQRIVNYNSAGGGGLPGQFGNTVSTYGSMMMNSNVHVKLGDYGISRFSYPLDVCKGYGGTEGFMAPEILKFNGEFEYTEKVDCYSYGMFVYELITLHHPYDGHEQMKDCIFEGQRPMVNEKDILCPSNVLDLMVACWADSASTRPSASDLVTITSAPEFAHLADVAVLQNDEITNLCTMVNIDDTAQLWLAKQNGDCTVMSLNQFGWIENENISEIRSKQVTAMAEVANMVWIGNAVGEITVYCPSTYLEQASFQITSIDPQFAKLNTAKTIRSIKFYSNSNTVLIALPQYVLLCSTQNGTLPQHCVTIASDEMVHSAILLENGSDFQIWTGHDDARIVTHYVVKATSKLLYSASVHHPNANGEGTPTAPRVKFLVPSQRYGTVSTGGAAGNSGYVIFGSNPIFGTSTNFGTSGAHGTAGTHGSGNTNDSSSSHGSRKIFGSNLIFGTSGAHGATGSGSTHDAGNSSSTGTPNASGATTSANTSYSASTNGTMVFTTLENDGRVFQWQNGTVKKTLDCTRILPVSESLSSMFESDDISTKKCKVTAIELKSGTNMEHLLVGTQNGVLIVMEAESLAPLTSFRTFEWAVETILAPITAWYPREEVQKHDEQHFFVTIGKKYRNLVKRLAPNVTETVMELAERDEQDENVNFAIVWQGDSWT
ncbi:unnamed protein product [Bursaphelenchus okinawaensis]|uniref:Protein kinase domain-containing protein n=1 Tax=Bursaphelenchus okinawaensis TaxID=465554 RepID=A0A811JW35_9BILA|nr:unnamed protein product [Bursaphelenchus okinawaensis]CAG9086478.1 unnamed protein product [Bursaphelenchus okinawaensis]